MSDQLFLVFFIFFILQHSFSPIELSDIDFVIDGFFYDFPLFLLSLGQLFLLLFFVLQAVLWRNQVQKVVVAASVRILALALHPQMGAVDTIAALLYFFLLFMGIPVDDLRDEVFSSPFWVLSVFGLILL